MNRFNVEQVKLYKEHMTLTTAVVIRYFDHLNPEAKFKEINVKLPDEVMAECDPLTSMQFVAEKAAALVKNQDFYDAMRDYFMNGDKDSFGYSPYTVSTGHAKHIHWGVADGILPKKSYHTSGLAFDFTAINEGKVSFSGGTIQKFGEDVSGTKKDMDAIHSFPGINEKVKHPETGNMETIKVCIITLNDQHGWSRERVADWLETLDVDLTFKTPDDILKEKGKKLLDEKIKSLSENIKIATENLEAMKKSLEEATFKMLELEATE